MSVVARDLKVVGRKFFENKLVLNVIQALPETEYWESFKLVMVYNENMKTFKLILKYLENGARAFEIVLPLQWVL